MTSDALYYRWPVRPKPSNKTVICPTCQKLFVSNKYHRTYCSQACFQARPRRYAIKVCPTCQRSFQPYRAASIYCCLKCVYNRRHSESPTPQEKRTADLLAEGYTTSQIAKIMVVERSTVNVYIHRLRKHQQRVDHEK